MKKRTLLLGLLAALPLALHAHWDDGATPYVQSPMDVVERMLKLAAPKRGEFIVDLGSGDGRIVIEAARRYRTRGLGVDIASDLVALANENARKAGVASLARFEKKDFFELDFSSADIVSAYLLPEVNLQIRPKLLAMKPGTRIVTHDYDMGDWPYDEMIEIPVAEKLVGPLGRSKIYLFVVPADARGVWRSTVKGHGGDWQFRISQQFQTLEIAAQVGGVEQAVRGARLRGTELRMVMSGLVAGKPATHGFRGRIRGDRIEGEISIFKGDDETTRTLPWTATRTK